ncbi:uncharacterized protein FTJAE_14141 [Fusarium tjaetaba]|uniref:Uncharacterized protein n=1 Tax=Fusarium tjaetaba TaxID=1567544 RepID=A0A8H5QA44_9HYPO|nr:uncharacterized protein FTJAE_14141 [Fusarium tjaetaba]KAF5611981.1 hypothetical protein FTJAE_14141 [Fusarium tjaetaba]
MKTNIELLDEQKIRERLHIVMGDFSLHDIVWSGASLPTPFWDIPARRLLAHEMSTNANMAFLTKQGTVTYSKGKGGDHSTGSCLDLTSIALGMTATTVPSGQLLTLVFTVDIKENSRRAREIPLQDANYVEEFMPALVELIFAASIRTTEPRLVNPPPVQKPMGLHSRQILLGDDVGLDVLPSQVDLEPRPKKPTLWREYL